jgi:hypothetical protein
MKTAKTSRFASLLAPIVLLLVFASNLKKKKREVENSKNILTKNLKLVNYSALPQQVGNINCSQVLC